MESPGLLLPWARLAMSAALRSKAAKAPLAAGNSQAEACAGRKAARLTYRK